MSELLTPLVRILKAHALRGGSDQLLDDTCKVLYVLVKVRGYKTIIKFFPHEVSDLEPLEKYLRHEAQSHSWQTVYVMMIWLAIVVMIPFDLATVDSQLSEAEGTLVERVIAMCKEALLKQSCIQQAAALLLQRLLTRKEVTPVHLSPTVEWMLQTVHECGEGPADDAKVIGVLTALDSIFKTATRDELLPFCERVLGLAQHVYVHPSTKRRLYGVKLAQRSALAFLKPRVAAWRYQRGQRSLALNLGETKPDIAPETHHEEDEDDEEMEYDEQVADAIDLLLNAVADKDTVCRWSAAKGIGRVSVRLPKSEADDVIGALLEMFQQRRTSDQFWHGACLTLGELARRGVLLPERLNEVVPVVQEALGFDQRRGTHSVGAHVRDAACYVCWAFARAYSPQVMKPHVANLASSLVITSLFDREVNCRRAASAAFQENVGRQGCFPHGIEVVTAADFFSLGNRVAAFTSIALCVADFNEYRLPILEHLLEVKVFHWDEAIRSLAAEALSTISTRDQQFLINVAIPTLLNHATDRNFSARHGSLLALAALLGKWRTEHPAEETLSLVMEQCGQAIASVHEKKLVRGSGGEATRNASARLLRALFDIQGNEGPAAASLAFEVLVTHWLPSTHLFLHRS